MKNSLKNKDKTTLLELVDIIAKLRDPKDGCEWDIKQTSKTLSPHIIEESYELVEAIESENNENIIDELGDLLLQILFHCQIAKENNNFEFADVIDKASKKMVRRHPHIFGKKKKKRSINEQKIFWEKIKEKERKEKREETSPFLKFNKYQPSLNQALKLQKIASTLGLDFSSIDEIFFKIEEEILEVKEAIKNNETNEKKNEIGDLFFSVINLARFLNFEPEQCIHETNKKFAKRCDLYFKLVEKYNSNLTMKENQKLWEYTKKKVQHE